MHKFLPFLLLITAYLPCQSQNVGIGTISPVARLHVTDSNVLFSATGTAQGLNNPPISGAGRRTMWFASKAAFRTGYVAGANWDRDSTGRYTFAANFDTKAKADYSSAFGRESAAEGSTSFAIGSSTRATGTNSFSSGDESVASGTGSFATGSATIASGTYSFACGVTALASGSSSFAIGYSTEARGQYAFSAGSNSVASGISATSFGSNTQALGNGAFVWGNGTLGSGINTTAAGQGTIAAGTAAASFGRGTIANGYASFVIGQYNDSVVAPQTQFSTAGLPLFIVGNGATETSRKNALIVNSDAHTGINTSTPQTFLDVDGDMSMRPYNLTLGVAGGPYTNVITNNRSFVHISGPAAPFSISGFQNGHDGKILVVLNMTGQNMTIENLSTTSETTNRINTLSGSNITTTGNGAVTMIYSGEENRWMVISVRD